MKVSVIGTGAMDLFMDPFLLKIILMSYVMMFGMNMLMP